jgi:DNA adenine methylase
MTAKIVPLLNSVQHKYYCEPFGGGASVLLAKPPVSVETYNDLDSGLYDFFTTLADPDAFQQFYRRVEALPYSRQLYNEARATWQNETDKIKRVVLWFILARQSFGGHFGHSWGTVVTQSTRRRAGTTSSWQQALHGLPQVHDRLQRVQIENKPAVDCIAQYDTPDTLFYCDPPYVLDTRSPGGYTHELTDDMHSELLDAILSASGSFVISGYNHPLYSRLDDYGYSRIDYQTASNAAARTRNSNLQGKGSALEHAARVESVWLKTSDRRQARLF